MVSLNKIQGRVCLLLRQGQFGKGKKAIKSKNSKKALQNRKKSCLQFKRFQEKPKTAATNAQILNVFHIHLVQT
jgi:hypothetical protein